MPLLLLPPLPALPLHYTLLLSPPRFTLLLSLLLCLHPFLLSPPCLTPPSLSPTPCLTPLLLVFSASLNPSSLVPSPALHPPPCPSLPYTPPYLSPPLPLHPSLVIFLSITFPPLVPSPYHCTLSSHSSLLSAFVYPSFSLEPTSDDRSGTQAIAKLQPIYMLSAQKLARCRCHGLSTTSYLRRSSLACYPDVPVHH